jgi:hypothetical protein
MGLHHIAASFLIFFSYVTNLTNFGLIVLFTHDFSDTFLIIARSITDFKYKYQLFLIKI